MKKGLSKAATSATTSATGRVKNRLSWNFAMEQNRHAFRQPMVAKVAWAVTYWRLTSNCRGTVFGMPRLTSPR